MPVYNTNFVKSQTGNVIKSLDTLTVTVEGADHVSGGIYKDNLPIQIDFGFKDPDTGNAQLEFKLAKRAIVDGIWRTVGLAPGKYLLKTRAYIAGRGQGWEDLFDIVD